MYCFRQRFEVRSHALPLLRLQAALPLLPLLVRRVLLLLTLLLRCC
jgi:hypothetical protein